MYINGNYFSMYYRKQTKQLPDELLKTGRGELSASESKHFVVQFKFGFRTKLDSSMRGEGIKTTDL